MATVIPLHFATSNMPGDVAVRFAQYGYIATHVDVCLPGDRFIGAIPTRGVNIYSHYPVVWERFLDLPCSDQQLADFMAWMTSQVGKPYAMIDLLGNFLAERDWRESSAWFCSELVAAGLERVGWFKALAVGVQKLSVRDLALCISANGVEVLF